MKRRMETVIKALEDAKRGMTDKRTEILEEYIPTISKVAATQEESTDKLHKAVKDVDYLEETIRKLDSILCDVQEIPLIDIPVRCAIIVDEEKSSDTEQTSDGGKTETLGELADFQFAGQVVLDEIYKDRQHRTIEWDVQDQEVHIRRLTKYGTWAQRNVEINLFCEIVMSIAKKIDRKANINAKEATKEMQKKHGKAIYQAANYIIAVLKAEGKLHSDPGKRGVYLKASQDEIREWLNVNIVEPSGIKTFYSAFEKRCE